MPDECRLLWFVGFHLWDGVTGEGVEQAGVHRGHHGVCPFVVEDEFALWAVPVLEDGLVISL